MVGFFYPFFLFNLIFFLLFSNFLFAFDSNEIKKVYFSFPDSSQSITLDKNSPYREAYLFKNGIYQKIIYLPQWINPQGKLETFILNNKLYHVVKSSSTYLNVNKIVFHSQDKIDKNYSFQFSPLAEKINLKILTPEILPPSISLSSTSINKGKYLTLADNISYTFFFRYLWKDSASNSFFKQIKWEFFSPQLNWKADYYGPRIKIFPLKIPNFKIDYDKYKFFLKLQITLSIAENKDIYRDVKFKRLFKLNILDNSRPKINFELKDYNVKNYFCGRNLTVNYISYFDNNINLPSKVNLKGFFFYFRGKNYISKKTPLKCPLNKEISKNIVLEPLFKSNVYFYIDEPQKIKIPLNYEGDFSLCFKGTDFTKNYTYEIISGNIVDKIPPYFSLNINNKELISLNFWENSSRHLFSHEVVIPLDLKKYFPNKRYNLIFTFRENIPFKMKSILINEKKIEFEKFEQKHDGLITYKYNFPFVLQNKKTINLKLTDKNNNIRKVTIVFRTSNEKFLIRKIGEEKK